MTQPRDPGETDPAGASPDRESRRGRHWAPDEEDAATDPQVADDDPSDVTEPSAGSTGGSGQDAAFSPEQPTTGDASPEVPADTGEPRAPDDGSGAAVAAGARRGPRHAAGGRGIRLQPWMLVVAAVVVIGLLAWLVLGLTTGTDSAGEPPPSTAASSSAEASSAAPTPVDPVSLPQVLCMGQSYAMIDTGQPVEQLLADPAAVEAQYSGSKLSTIPPGCIAGSDERDQVVLALGPFPTIKEACDAGKATGTTFTAYEGSADTGLKSATCPA